MLSKQTRKRLAKRISARRVVVTSLAVDLLDIGLNFAVAMITGSVVMVAEALQGVADLTASAFLMIGLIRSRRPADQESPFGYGKEIYFWALLAGLLMVTITASLSIYFGWQRILNPEQISNLYLAYGVLSIGVISNGYSLSLSARRILGRHPFRLIGHAFMQSALVETKTTFVLDLMGTASAVLGLLSLLVLGGTGDSLFDGLGAVLIGLTVAFLAVLLLLGVQDLLVGKSAHPNVEELIRQTVLAHEKVTDVLELKTMHIGTEKLLVNLEVHFAHDLTTQEIERLVDDIKTKIKTVVPSAKHIQVELETPRKELQELRE